MKALIFGGTTEGRLLAKALSETGIHVTLSVATDFGREIYADVDAALITGRLESSEMSVLMKEGLFDHVIDATHPYAAVASENIRLACQATDKNYYRLIRDENKTTGLTFVPDIPAAVEWLKNSREKALLTIGSKELTPFTGIEDFRERLFVRILPMKESLEKALGLGFSGSNIICMQGPFSEEMNAATLASTGAKVLVTKDSGESGGFSAKVSAALALGCRVVVIDRPEVEKGHTLDELLDIFNIKKSEKEEKLVFPLFIDIKGRKALVIGGGKVASRRIEILKKFGAEITVISPKSTEYIKQAAGRGEIDLLEREYKTGDITEQKPFLVLVCTDDRLVNQTATREATGLDILVSVSDDRLECKCFFPAVCENESYTIGIVSKNGDHRGVKILAEKVRKDFLT